MITIDEDQFRLMLEWGIMAERYGACIDRDEFRTLYNKLPPNKQKLNIHLPFWLEAGK